MELEVRREDLDFEVGEFLIDEPDDVDETEVEESEEVEETDESEAFNDMADEDNEGSEGIEETESDGSRKEVPGFWLRKERASLSNPRETSLSIVDSRRGDFAVV